MPARSNRERFTPTGVGTTIVTDIVISRRPVHPHGRGDNAGSARDITRPHGSPPRAWGQPHRFSAIERAIRFTPTGVGTTIPQPTQMQNRRFTPTGVGTTSTNGSFCIGSEVHPHGRGDNPCFVRPDTIRDGSPPRAWGQRTLITTEAESGRFTPTGVGTTRLRLRLTG